MTQAKTATKELDLCETAILPPRVARMATRRVWLPKLIYESLPWFYLLAGAAAFFTTLYISDWFWVMPYYILFSAGCLHLAYAVYSRRRRARRQERLNPSS